MFSILPKKYLTARLIWNDFALHSHKKSYHNGRTHSKLFYTKLNFIIIRHLMKLRHLIFALLSAWPLCLNPASSPTYKERAIQTILGAFFQAKTRAEIITPAMTAIARSFHTVIAETAMSTIASANGIL